MVHKSMSITDTHHAKLKILWWSVKLLKRFSNLTVFEMAVICIFDQLHVYAYWDHPLSIWWSSCCAKFGWNGIHAVVSILCKLYYFSTMAWRCVIMSLFGQFWGLWTLNIKVDHGDPNMHQQLGNMLFEPFIIKTIPKMTCSCKKQQNNILYLC